MSLQPKADEMTVYPPVITMPPAHPASTALGGASDRPGSTRISAGAVVLAGKTGGSHRVPKLIAPRLG